MGVDKCEGAGKDRIHSETGREMGNKENESFPGKARSTFLY